LKETGSGGGGELFRIGRIGTRGRYVNGATAGDLVPKRSIVPELQSSDVTVSGTLDKDLVRQQIHRNRGQIRFCYERELQTHPKLAGRILLAFVILPSGGVGSADVVEASTGNRALEECVASRVRQWQFPKPRGRGSVKVVYPFVFKQTGRGD